MSKRARRGLGFVVLALLFWLIAVAANDSVLVQGVAVLGLIACGLYGLLTLAWGLIRD
jgi:hypothetical protein